MKKLNSIGFKLFAFTLAEVLVTLGIIGVVASMTIPTLINKHREQITVAKVKKFYSTMSNAYLLSVKDNGYANEWNVSSGQSATTAGQIATYLKPYLKIIKDCGTSFGCLGYTEDMKSLKDTTIGNYDTKTPYYKAILSDGSFIWWRGSATWCQTTDASVANTCVAIWTDINGSNKPNTLGKDIFYVFITPVGIKPAANNDCNKTGYGWGCSGYILKNGNMNYLH